LDRSHPDRRPDLCLANPSIRNAPVHFRPEYHLHSIQLWSSCWCEWSSPWPYGVFCCSLLPHPPRAYGAVRLENGSVWAQPPGYPALVNRLTCSAERRASLSIPLSSSSSRGWSVLVTRPRPHKACLKVTRWALSNWIGHILTDVWIYPSITC
jgi:hypothetical protein